MARACKLTTYRYLPLAIIERRTVEYAAVPIIDFARAHTFEGRADLAPQVRDAMRTYGFMCIVNHGLTQAQVSP